LLSNWESSIITMSIKDLSLSMHIDSEMHPYLLKSNLKKPNLYGPLQSTPNKRIERERETVAYFYQLRDDK